MILFFRTIMKIIVYSAKFSDDLALMPVRAFSNLYLFKALRGARMICRVGRTLAAPMTRSRKYAYNV